MRRKTLECIDFNESNVRTIVRNNLFLFDGRRIIRIEFFELKLLRFNFTVSIIASKVIHIGVFLFSLVKNYHQRISIIIVEVNDLEL